MRRLLLSLSAVALVCGFLAPANASAQQSLNFFLGGFVPRSIDARDCPNLNTGACDVIVENSTFLSTFNRNNGIDMGKFSGVTVGGEWLFGINHFLEGGLGLGYYQKSVDTSYTDFVNADGSEIAQTLKLRVVPFTATVRLLPFGNEAPIQPYVGAGVGVLSWRYSETGQFIDFTPGDCNVVRCNVFTNTYAGSHSDVGPVILGGVRVPIGSVAPGFEIRYQSAKGTLPASQGFAGDRIDLGGMNYLFVLNIRF